MGYMVTEFMLMGTLLLRVANAPCKNAYWEWYTQVRCGSFLLGILYYYVNDHIKLSKKEAKILLFSPIILIPYYIYYTHKVVDYTTIVYFVGSECDAFNNILFSLIIGLFMMACLQWPHERLDAFFGN